MGGGVLCKFLGTSVPLGLSNPYPKPHNVRLSALTTLFLTRHLKSLTYPKLAIFQKLYLHTTDQFPGK